MCLVSDYRYCRLCVNWPRLKSLKPGSGPYLATEGADVVDGGGRLYMVEQPGGRQRRGAEQVERRQVAEHTDGRQSSCVTKKLGSVIVRVVRLR